MPASTRPLLRPVQLHRVQPHLHAVTIGAGRNLAIGGKQRQPTVPRAPFIKGFDQAVPSLELAVMSLISPRYSTCRWTTLPPAQRLFSTIFQYRCSLPSLKRRLDRKNMMRINLRQPASSKKGGRSTLQATCDRAPLIRLAFLGRRTAKIDGRAPQLLKLG